MENDYIDVTIWCRLCGENIITIGNQDPHDRRPGNRLSHMISIETIRHQTTDEHRKKRVEAKMFE